MSAMDGKIEQLVSIKFWMRLGKFTTVTLEMHPSFTFQGWLSVS
jgi:hypothetical protein